MEAGDSIKSVSTKTILKNSTKSEKFQELKKKRVSWGDSNGRKYLEDELMSQDIENFKSEDSRYSKEVGIIEKERKELNGINENHIKNEEDLASLKNAFFTINSLDNKANIKANNTEIINESSILSSISDIKSPISFKIFTTPVKDSKSSTHNDLISPNSRLLPEILKLSSKHFRKSDSSGIDNTKSNEYMLHRKSFSPSCYNINPASILTNSSPISSKVVLDLINPDINPNIPINSSILSKSNICFISDNRSSHIPTINNEESINHINESPCQIDLTTKQLCIIPEIDSHDSELSSISSNTHPKMPEKKSKLLEFQENNTGLHTPKHHNLKITSDYQINIPTPRISNNEHSSRILTPVLQINKPECNSLKNERIFKTEDIKTDSELLSNEIKIHNCTDFSNIYYNVFPKLKWKKINKRNAKKIQNLKLPYLNDQEKENNQKELENLAKTYNQSENDLIKADKELKYLQNKIENINKIQTDANCKALDELERCKIQKNIAESRVAKLTEENITLCELKCINIPLEKRWYNSSIKYIGGEYIKVFNHIPAKDSPFFKYLVLVIRISDNSMKLKCKKDFGSHKINKIWAKYSEYIIEYCKNLPEKEKLNNTCYFWCNFVNFAKNASDLHFIGENKVKVTDKSAIFFGEIGGNNWKYIVDFENLEKHINIFSIIIEKTIQNIEE